MRQTEIFGWTKPNFSALEIPFQAIPVSHFLANNFSTTVWHGFWFFDFRLGKDDFQKLSQSYPDLRQKVEKLAIERIEQVLMIEEREKHRKPFGYASVNQQQFSNIKRSVSQWTSRKIQCFTRIHQFITHSLLDQKMEKKKCLQRVKVKICFWQGKNKNLLSITHSAAT